MNDEADMGESVKGAYSYLDDEGKNYSVSYTADENGYRPVRPSTFVFVCLKNDMKNVNKTKYLFTV